MKADIDVRRRFGIAVRRRRRLLGLTQAEVSYSVGLTQGHLSKLERGLVEPGISTALLLATALSTSIGRLAK